jgi:multiple sugar transport system substrate-binding protein
MTRSQRVGGASRVSRRWLLAGTAGMAAAGTALSAAACSPPGGSGGAAPGGAGASIRPGTTLRLYDGVSGTLVEPYNEILAQFTARTGAKVEADPPVSSGVWNEVLLSQVSGGTAPDVSVGYGNELFFFIDNGAATDITQRVARDVPKADFDDWLPSQVQMFKRNGKQYALPKYCGTSAFYYNKTMFNQAGVPFPDDKMTWMQYREKLVALTKSDGATNTTFGLSHNSAAHLGYIMSWMVWSWGGEVTDPQDDSKCLLDQPPALEALQFWQDLRWKYHVLPTPDEGAALGSGNLFSRSIAATERNGSWLIPTYQMDNPALQWDVFPNPLGPTGKRATQTSNRSPYPPRPAAGRRWSGSACWVG